MITTVTYGRLYNLGNYENEKLEVTIAVEDNDATAAFITAIATIETEHLRMIEQRRAPQVARLIPPASDKQRNYIATLCDELGWTSEQIAVYAKEQNVDLVAMTVPEASKMIDGLRKLID